MFNLEFLQMTDPDLKQNHRQHLDLQGLNKSEMYAEAWSHQDLDPAAASENHCKTDRKPQSGSRDWSNTDLFLGVCCYPGRRILHPQ